MPAPPCTACKAIMGSFARGHTEDVCPIRRGSYCNLCCSYGHAPAECRDSAILADRQPRFLEQLIAPSLLEMYGIHTRTPLESRHTVVPATDDILEVPETEEALRTILRAYNVDPMICQKKGREDKKELKENKKRLQKLADSLGRRLVFAAPASSLDAAAATLGSLFEGPAAPAAKPKPKKIVAPSKENDNGGHTVKKVKPAAANASGAPKTSKKAAHTAGASA